MTVLREVRGDRMAVEASFLDPIPRKPAVEHSVRTPAVQTGPDTAAPTEP
jgi:hypothetical protein